ncbi:uncharacterized protein EI90DRAFT_3128251 [Cantharellus anzutake]|uniref:uncharacterized protein n=1 Tax=Cantharellus anzutake TaxID=1750568 RepID=UPI0019069D43|nr:uncharacterized protein EI90DRAFT_3128251 [Cantharellus anzutake]KAF8326111.1 hypothetical protein EI90DRAFT_3128251 [Cantharellus anzutake]
MNKLDIKFWAENSEKRSIWPAAYLLGATDLIPLPKTCEDALSKLLVNGHANYLPDNSTIVLDALIDGKGRTDQVSLWVPDDWDHVLSLNGGICKRIQNYLTHNPATSNVPTMLAEIISRVEGMITQPSTCQGSAPDPAVRAPNHTPEPPSQTSPTPQTSPSLHTSHSFSPHTASSTNGPDVKTTSKSSGAKLHFGLQIDLPLHTMDPSKDTVSHVLDVPKSWTPKHALLTIASEMGVNLEVHRIAYKTSKMKVRDDPVPIDCAGTLAAGLEHQRCIQSCTFEQKHLKIINLAKGKKSSTDSKAGPATALRSEKFCQLLEATLCSRHSCHCYPHPKAEWGHLRLSNEALSLWANCLSEGRAGVTLDRPPHHNLFDPSHIKHGKRPQSHSPPHTFKHADVTSATAKKYSRSLSPLHNPKHMKTAESPHVDSPAGPTPGPSTFKITSSSPATPTLKPRTLKVAINSARLSIPICAPLINISSSSPVIASSSPTHGQCQVKLNRHSTTVINITSLLSCTHGQRQVKHRVKHNFHLTTIVDIPSSPTDHLSRKHVNSPPIAYLGSNSESEDDVGFDIERHLGATSHSGVRHDLVELSNDELDEAVNELDANDADSDVFL